MTTRLNHISAAAACVLVAACSDARLPPEQAHHAQCRHASGDATGFRWLLSARAAERPALDAYCAGVGPAVVKTAPDSGARAAGERFVVVTWNMAHGLGDLRRLVAELRRGVHTGGEPAQSFALLVQEAPRRGGAVPRADALPEDVAYSAADEFPGVDIVELAAELGLALVYVPSMRNGRGAGAVAEDEGNAILSTAPLTAPAAHELPPGIRRRVAVAADVTLAADRPLRLVSAHLDNSSLRRPVGSFGGIRARQASALAAMLPASAPVLLGADLNTWARQTREPAFRVLRRRLPRPEPLPSGATARRLGVPRRLDYLLLGGLVDAAFETRRLDERYGSDHHPLIGILELHGQQRER